MGSGKRKSDLVYRDIWVIQKSHGTPTETKITMKRYSKNYKPHDNTHYPRKERSKKKKPENFNGKKGNRAIWIFYKLTPWNTEKRKNKRTDLYGNDEDFTKTYFLKWKIHLLKENNCIQLQITYSWKEDWWLEVVFKEIATIKQITK